MQGRICSLHGNFWTGEMFLSIRSWVDCFFFKNRSKIFHIQIRKWGILYAIQSDLGSCRGELRRKNENHFLAGNADWNVMHVYRFLRIFYL